MNYLEHYCFIMDDYEVIKRKISFSRDVSRFILFKKGTKQEMEAKAAKASKIGAAIQLRVCDYQITHNSIHRLLPFHLRLLIKAGEVTNQTENRRFFADLKFLKPNGTHQSEMVSLENELLTIQSIINVLENQIFQVSRPGNVSVKGLSLDIDYADGTTKVRKNEDQEGIDPERERAARTMVQNHIKQFRKLIKRLKMMFCVVLKHYLKVNAKNKAINDQLKLIIYEEVIGSSADLSKDCETCLEELRKENPYDLFQIFRLVYLHPENFFAQYFLSLQK
eukprot:TRINITY_DN3382_c0_g1_i1.p1 TRINITY_DN3382_c0_g1~~TRINITY_DN3382_c0_g1_i1.p1  ORF type:complete len:316 (-),score=85.75 TRINITY_DN3382_c0_g1_i1:758-1594(-)